MHSVLKTIGWFYFVNKLNNYKYQIRIRYIIRTNCVIVMNLITIGR